MKTLQPTKMAAIAVILSMCIGCATMKGTTPDKAVAIVMADFQAALKAQDLEKIMEFYSNNFIDWQGANKDMVRSEFDSMASQGILKNLTFVELEEGAIRVNGDNATVTPLVVDSPMGKMEFHCTLKKKTDGVWRLVSYERINR